MTQATRITVFDAVVVELDVEFTFGDLCRACEADAASLAALVDEGLLQPSGSGPDDWLFEGRALARARSALRLARELELGLHATALVLELIDEIELLKARLHRAGLA